MTGMAFGINSVLSDLRMAK